jgi:hypothetical protein
LETSFEFSREPGYHFHEKDRYLHVGFTSPDQDPLTCTIDPQFDYRITGTRGTNAGLGILAMDTSTMQHVGWLNHQDLILDDSGGFEIVASRQPHSGNWLELSDQSSLLVIRCNFNDREREERAEFAIEQIGARVVREPITANDVIGGLRSAILSSSVMSKRMVEWAEELVERPNELCMLESYSRSGGSPDHDFRFGYFDLADDEAIEVTFEAPECDNWQFQVGNWWVENLDNYADDQSWLNKRRAEVDPEGRVTLVMSLDAIPVANWVETFGRRSGIMGLRFVGAHTVPNVTVRKVSRDSYGTGPTPDGEESQALA